MATIKIVFLIMPHPNMLDMAGASQAFHEAAEHGVDIEIDYCSFEKNIVSSSNLPLGKIRNYQTIALNKGDYFFIASADIHYLLSKEFRPDQELLDWIVAQYNKGVNICAICNGAFLLGETGLLNGRNCTTHWNRTGDLQRKFPLANVMDNILFIEDGGIYTSAGAISGVDIALHIISKLKGDYFSYKISRELVVYNRRSGNDSQQSSYLDYRNHMHMGIHQVQNWLQENMEKKTTIQSLAEKACMSSRNFTRIFRKETGITVNYYINLLRKERISQLIKNPDITRKEIASRCGLKSERQVARLLAG